MADQDHAAGRVLMAEGPTVRSQARSEIVFQSFVPEISSFSSYDAGKGGTLSWLQSTDMVPSPRPPAVNINDSKMTLICDRDRLNSSEL